MRRTTKHIKTFFVLAAVAAIGSMQIDVDSYLTKLKAQATKEQNEFLERYDEKRRQRLSCGVAREDVTGPKSRESEQPTCK